MLSIVLIAHEVSGLWMLNQRLQVCSYATSDSGIHYFQEEEIQRLEQLQKSSDTSKIQTPFTIMAQGTTGGSRKQIDRFDNKVLREHISCFLINTNAFEAGLEADVDSEAGDGDE